MKDVVVSSIKISDDDMELFARLSSDRNPMHMEPAYARQSPFGEQIVFGMLGCALGLGKVENKVLIRTSGIRIDFQKPMFPGREYFLETSESEERCVLKIRGEEEICTEIDFLLEAAKDAYGITLTADGGNREKAAIYTEDELKCRDISICRNYDIAEEILVDFMNRFRIPVNIYTRQCLKIFSMASYIIGMELPGRDAMFMSAVFDFRNSFFSEGGTMKYMVSKENYDDSFHMLTLKLKVEQQGNCIVTGHLNSFVKMNGLDRIFISDDAGKLSTDVESRPVAVVTGGSRGFGAALCQCLVQNGYRVVLNYCISEKNALELQEAIHAKFPGTVILFQGDITDKKVCDGLAELLEKKLKRLDLLICNATCSPLAEKSTIRYGAEARKYYRTPVESLLQLLKKNRSCIVAVSSDYVENGPEEMKHYISAKREMEHYMEECSENVKECRFLTVRPKAMATSMNNTPLGMLGTSSPADIAGKVIRYLEKFRAGDRNYQVLSDSADTFSVGLASTFTVDGLVEKMKKAGEELALNIAVESAGYNQVLQALLNRKGVFYRNGNNVNVVFLRLNDFHRYKIPLDQNGFIEKEDEYDEKIRAYYSEVTEEYCSALRCYNSVCTVPLILVITPNAERYECGDKWKELFREMRSKITETADGLNRIHVVIAEEYHRLYGIDSFRDEVTDLLGHIPYIVPYYSYLALLTFRHIAFLLRKKPKVIVTDCDNTLWKGIVGEDGLDRIEISGGFKMWQEKLCELKSHGWLICLCSKNNPEDVFEVFDKRKDMILKREDIVDYNISWEAKSIGIRKIAARLNLGPDSFVFVDDSESECLEVRKNCPEVITLCFPEERDTSRFVGHMWILDDFDKATREDKLRSDFYKSNVQRDLLKQESGDMEDFLNKLEMEWSFSDVRKEDCKRVSQLTMRTNQFNFTTRRRNEQQILELLEQKNYHAVVLQVRDRFGDYGQVGCIILNIYEDCIEVDTFLLSCRVLGREIEYRMIEYIAGLAEEYGCRKLRIPFIVTGKNEPALEFYKRLIDYGNTGDSLQIGNGRWIAEFDAAVFKKIRLKNAENAGEPKEEQKTGSFLAEKADIRKKEAEWKRICETLSDIDKLDSVLSGTDKEQESEKMIPDICEDKRKEIEENIRGIIRHCTGMKENEISFSTNIEQFCWSSLKKVEISSEVIKKYPHLTVTFLYRSATLKDVVDEIQFGDREDTEANSITESTGDGADDDIAIIGMDAKLPGADTLDEFWRILDDGRCVITKVPGNRWNSSVYYDESASGKGKTYCRHGGFIEDFEGFDNRFFGISAKEAMAMDPQQRLFLQAVWKAIENAGYKAEKLDRRTGVYVGAISGDFGQYLNETAGSGENAYRWGDFYQIANRISYFFDFKGPSLVVDTACSSSGTALYLACRDLAGGICNTAVAGGVNLLLHPSRYIQYSAMGLLTKGEACYPFSGNAGGTIMGEGICALVLKRKSDAQRDGDYIYGIIKGCSVNSCGKTNGFTVPNPKAQTDLIKQALENAKVSPRQISYIEAHGTGTIVGDPIEIDGIKGAFADRQTPLHIGSVKSNIGHLESASTMASLIKVLLQMKYRRLVPSINAYPLNELLQLSEDRFVIQRTAEEWKAPGEKLYAGVSSFGAGGSNAHIVLESYDNYSDDHAREERYLIILSARSREQLLRTADQICRHIQFEMSRNAVSDEKDYLERVSYTLMVGRMVYDYRFACTAGSLRELCDILQKLSREGKEDSSTSLIHKVWLTEETEAFSKEEAEYFGVLYRNRKLDRIARLWMMGVEIPWEILWEKRGKRIPLPGMAFDERHFPLEQIRKNVGNVFYSEIKSPIHPEKIYETSIGISRFPHLIDHQVNHVLIVPGAFPLSLMLTVLMKSRKMDVVCAEDIIFRKALILKEDSLYETQVICSGENSVSVYVNQTDSASEDDWYLYTKGTARIWTPTDKKMNLQQISEECREHISKEAFYEYGRDKGFFWGKEFQCVQDVWLGQESVLSRLSFSRYTSEDSVFPSPVLDACLQTYLYAMEEHCRKPGCRATYIPFSIDRFLLYKRIPEHIYAYTRWDAGGDIKQEYFVIDVVITNDDGNVICEIQGLKLKKVGNNILNSNDHIPDNCLYRSEWLEAEGKEASGSDGDSMVTVWYSGSELLRKLVEESHITDTFRAVDLFWEESTEKDASGLRNRIWNLVEMLKEFSDSVKDTEHRLVILKEENLAAEEENPLAEAFFGMAKVLNSENSNIKVTVISIDRSDLESADGEQRLYSHLTEEVRRLAGFAESGGFAEYRLSNFRLLKKGLIPVKTDEDFHARKFVQEGDTFVLLGGAGGIGFEVSKYLAGRGGRIVWIGRRARSVVEDRIAEINRLGGQAEYVQADAVDGEELEKKLREALAGRKVRAVFFCAIVLRDVLIGNMTREQFFEAFDAKAFAAANLIRVLAKESEYMVNFSSECVFRGSPAQVNYVAGCRFLDAYMRKVCRENGIVLHNINWGLWGETGIVSKGEYTKRLQTIGLLPFTTVEGIRILEDILGAGGGQMTAIKINESYLKKANIYKEWNESYSKELCMPSEEIVRAVKPYAERYDFSRISLYNQQYPEMIRYAGYVAQTLRQKIHMLDKGTILKEYAQYIRALDDLGPEKAQQNSLERYNAKENYAMFDDGIKAWFDFINLAGRNAIDIIMGRKKYSDVFFAKGSNEIVEGIYKANPISAFFNDQTACILKELLAALCARKSQKIRILEFGAGTGSTTEKVLEMIGEFADRIEYVFTDVSLHFLKMASDKYSSRYPFVKYQLFDFTKDIREQKIERESFHIILGTNAVHICADLRSVLRNLSQALTADGYLLINELTTSHTALTMAYGLFTGWWDYRDGECRITNSPLLSKKQWLKELNNLGFREVKAFDCPNEADETSPMQTVFLAGSAGLYRTEEEKISVKEVAGAEAIPDVKEISAKTDPVQAVRVDENTAKPDNVSERGRDLKEKILKLLRFVLMMEENEKISAREGFKDLGLDSLLAIQFRDGLEELTGLKLSSTIVYDYSNIDDLYAYLLTALQPEREGRKTGEAEERKGQRPDSGNKDQAYRHFDSIQSDIDASSEEDVMKLLIQELNICE